MTKEATASEQEQGLTGGGESEKKASRQGSGRSMKSAKSKSPSVKAAAAPTSAASLPLASIQQRRIRAEDPDWSLETVPLLVDLVVKHIVQNFEYNSKILHSLPEKHKRKVLDSISTSIPLKVTALLVEYEGYWKRCCQARWQKTTGDVSLYGNSWKRMYFEHHLQEIIENFVPGTTDQTQLNETMPLSATFIRRLDIKQLLPPVKEAPKGPDTDDLSDGEDTESVEGNDIDHFDFEPIMKQLPFLEEFHVTYGVKNCGMNFEWSLFQFTARDCLLLAKCIAACKTLKVFRLHKSKVDDDKVRVLISHILDHPGLTELDLSHNIISDRGARAIGKFLNNHSQLVKLNLCDNNIRGAGAQAIGHALTKNSTLKSLNLRMNRLADEGGQAICRALLKNETLLDLNLGSNDLTEPTATFLFQVLIENKTLSTIDLSCNRLGPDGGKQLQEGMEENETVTEMDLRLTECGQESEYCIQQILSRNRERKRQLEETSMSSKPSEGTPQDNAMACINFTQNAFVI